MPELPEVETIRRNIHPLLIGRSVTASQVTWPRSIAEPLEEPQQFTDRIIGQQIKGSGRRGKYFLLDLSDDVLIVHLRMSGDLRVETVGAEILAHDRVIVRLDDGHQLVFNDARKFGRMWLTSDPQSVIGKLGPEPLDDELTPRAFYTRLQAHHRQIKPLLLDQTFIAGIGNIYSDEGLHLAQIHPLTSSDSLSPAQSEKLLYAIRSVLNEGIRRNGASIDWVYRGGDFQNHFRVYRRTDQPCPVCGTAIERKVIGQRSTHFCPTCQPLVE